MLCVKVYKVKKKYIYISFPFGLGWVVEVRPIVRMWDLGLLGSVLEFLRSPIFPFPFGN